VCPGREHKRCAAPSQSRAAGAQRSRARATDAPPRFTKPLCALGPMARRRGSSNRCVRWGRQRAAAAHQIVACPGAPRQEMAAVCKPGGRLLLLEHGRASAGWLNQRLDDGAERHHAKFGCHWNRPILDIVEEVRGRADAHPRHACMPGVAGTRTGPPDTLPRMCAGGCASFFFYFQCGCESSSVFTVSACVCRSSLLLLMRTGAASRRGQIRVGRGV
jgi:hypothetical protein